MNADLTAIATRLRRRILETSHRAGIPHLGARVMVLQHCSRSLENGDSFLSSGLTNLVLTEASSMSIPRLPLILLEWKQRLARSVMASLWLSAWLLVPECPAVLSKATR